MSLWPFRLRRDSSVDAIPVAGYQDAVDAIDVIQWGSMPFTETLNTDASGYVTLTYHPIDVSHDWVVDSDGTPRERKIDGADIQALTAASATLYPAQANGQTKRVQLFQDAALTVAAASMSGVVVTYRRLIPQTLDANGNLVTISGGGTGTIADVSDRSARQLGQVTLVPGSTMATDVSDRATRQVGVVAPGIADTVSAAGFVAVPGAGATICQTNTLTAGVYRVEVNAYIAGSASTPQNEAANMGLYHGGNFVGPVFGPVNAGGVQNAHSPFPRVTVNASERLIIGTFGGSNGGYYVAGLTATRLS